MNPKLIPPNNFGSDLHDRSKITNCLDLEKDNVCLTSPESFDKSLRMTLSVVIYDEFLRKTLCLVIFDKFPISFCLLEMDGFLLDIFDYFGLTCYLLCQSNLLVK